MTDREMLELAAKAAGHTVHAERQAERDACGHGDMGLWLTDGTTCWNPLRDDGEALRLACALGMVVDCSRPSAGAPYTQHAVWLDETMSTEELARRAIVQAAAEFGAKIRE